MPVAREQWENPVIPIFPSQMSLISNDVNFWIILLIAVGCYQRVDAQVFSLAKCPTVSVVSNFDSSKVNFNSQSFLSFQVLCPKTKPKPYNICIIKPQKYYHWTFFFYFLVDKVFGHLVQQPQLFCHLPSWFGLHNSQLPAKSSR